MNVCVVVCYRMILPPHHFHHHPQISIQELPSDLEEEQITRQLPCQLASEEEDPKNT